MKKYRFKTKQEFEETCRKDMFGAYVCGNDTFEQAMHPLFGKEYNPINNLNIVECNGMSWNVKPQMLVEINEYI